MGSVKKTETGSVLNFNTYLPKNLDETKVSFTPKQSGSGTPSPENVREIVGKNGITVWQSNDDRARPLPKEYQQVEYIGTTGTQWLDTGVVPTVNTKSQIKMLAREMSGYVFYGLFTGNDATDYRLFMNNTRMYWDMPGGRIMTLVNTATTGTIYELELGNRYIKDLPTGTYPASNTRLDFELTNTITLNSYNGTQFSKSNWYYVKIYEADTLIRDFVPCYRKSDSVAGMYDLVSGTFYTNSGTGEFLVGEDIVGVETSVSFPAVGKNLCPDISTWESGYTNNTGGISTASSTRLEKYSDYIPVDELENYTFSYNADGITEQLWTCICAYDENKEYLIRHTSNSNFVSRKLIAGTRFVRLSCRTYGMTTEAQFEKSAEPTEYEPFDNTIYGGYVDLVNGEVVAEWTKVDMGERNWAVAWNTFNTAPSNAANNGAGNTPTNIMCDIYPSDINTSATGVGVINKNIRGRANYKHICIRDDDYATAEDFKTAVTGHYLAYKLAEPIHYPLTPRILTTLQGVNTMWSDGDSLTISYTDDVVNTYDFRRHISLDTPHKASASGAVASFGTDMVGKMKCKIHFLPKQEGSGTPSPDNVRNISGRDSVKLWQSGKNIFGGWQVASLLGYTESNIHEDENGRYVSIGSKNEVLIPEGIFKENTQYTFIVKSYTGDSSKMKNFRIYYTDGTVTDVTSPSGVGTVAVTTDASKKIRGIAIINRSVTRYFYFEESGFFEGVCTVDDFEPYKGLNEITFTFPSTVGDNGVVYGGYLDAENGEVVQEYYTFTLDGTNNKLDSGGTILNGNECEAYTYFGQGTLSGIPRGRGTSYTQLYSNLLPTVRQTSGRGEIVQADDVVNYIRVQLYAETIGVTSGATTTEVIDAINTWLTAHPMQVCYPLRDPVHYSLTPQSIATLKGSNRIWSDGDSVEVEYYKHTDEPQEYLPIDAIVTNNGFVLVTSDGYAVGETNDYIKY